MLRVGGEAGRGRGLRGAMGGTGVMMCVVLLILGVESSQAQAVCGSDGMCDFPGLIATPKSGTVIQVLCSYDNFVRCPAISWHTVFGASNYSSLQLGDYAGITTPDSTQEQCDVPSTGVFTNSSSVKRCGNTPVSIGAVGSKYVSVRQTFKPSTYFKSHNSSYVCWSLKNTAGQNSPQRCVYFQTVVRPNTIQISAPTFMLGSSTTVRISVGQTLRLRVWTYHVMEGVKADVDLKVDGCDSIESTNVLCPSPELPNQRWEGPTTCVAGNTTTTCERYLIYSPFKSEDKQQYRFALQAKLSNLAVTITSPLVASGVACGAKEGACAPAPYLDAAVTNYRVVVSTLQPVFASYDPGRILYTLPGVRTDPPVYTLPGTPVDGIELPKAFINCPLSGFGIYVSKEDANPENIDISFLPAGPGEPDAIARGVQVTRGYYAPVATGGDNPVSNTDAVDANTKYLKYVGVTWTPPAGAMGQTFQVCFRASEKGSGPSGQQIEISSAQACVKIQVEPCMYCTLRNDTLQSIAARFRTTWTQIWSANYEGWYEMNPAFSGSAANPWRTTKDPDTLADGMLIRLGPVYRANFDSPIESLTRRFQTTPEALRAANPEIVGAGPGDMVRAGQQVCVLPDICTMGGGADP